MGRPRLPLGAHGVIHTEEIAAGRWRARVCFRFPDGVTRQVARCRPTRDQAVSSLLRDLGGGAYRPSAASDAADGAADRAARDAGAVGRDRRGG